MTFSPAWHLEAMDEAEPPVDWAEIESEEAQEAREEAENGRG